MIDLYSPFSEVERVLRDGNDLPTLARKHAERLEVVYNAIRFAVARFDRINWGYDGDCGSKDIIEMLEDILPENEKKVTHDDHERLLRPSWMTGDTSNDWTEDFAHENGNYYEECVTCGLEFVGHKRRHICRKCHYEANARYDDLTAEERATFDEKRSAEIRAFFKTNGEHVQSLPTQDISESQDTQTTNEIRNTDTGSGLHDADCCASDLSVQTCINREFPDLAPSAIPSPEWMQEWRSRMCAMAPDWLSRCAKEWLSERD